MARRRRYSPIGVPQHVIQRGNNRQNCFTGNQDMAAYANWLNEAAHEYGLLIHAWVFMSNHIHLLATPTQEDSLSKVMQDLGRQYVRYFNHRYQRSGTLFEGRFRSCLVQDETYLLICHRYIELNPVRAGMVTNPSAYVWSSYHANGLGRAAKIWTPHPLYLELGKTGEDRQKNYRSLFDTEINPTLLTKVRQSLNQGLTLGSEDFKNQMETLTGGRQRLSKRGPEGIKIEG
jgi:putative transposase